MKISEIETALLGRQFSPFLKGVVTGSLSDGASRVTAIDPLLAQPITTTSSPITVRKTNEVSGMISVEGIGMLPVRN